MKKFIALLSAFLLISTSVFAAPPVKVEGGNVSVDSVNSQSAHDAAVSGAPVRVGFRARTTAVTSVASNDTVDGIATLGGRQVVLPYQIPELTWSSTGDQDSTTDTSIQAASAGLRHCVTSAQVVAIDSIAADETFRILSADTVLWQWVINTTTTSAISVHFPAPICTVAGEALEVDTAGDPADNLIFYNLQGYTAP